MKKILIVVMTFTSLYASAQQSKYHDFRVLMGSCDQGTYTQIGPKLDYNPTYNYSSKNARLLFAKNSEGKAVFQIFPFGSATQKDALNRANLGYLDPGIDQMIRVSDTEMIDTSEGSYKTASGFLVDYFSQISAIMSDNGKFIKVNLKEEHTLIAKKEGPEIKMIGTAEQVCNFNNTDL